MPAGPEMSPVTTTATDPDGVSIRPAERADLLGVIRIEKASFPQPWPYDAFLRFLDEPGFLVAVENGLVLGYIVADAGEDFGTAVGHVKDLAVHPDHRGRGIGSRLLNRGLQRLRRQNAGRVKLEVRASNEAAIGLYDRFGFETHHTIPNYYDDGEDALVLILSLTP